MANRSLLDFLPLQQSTHQIAVIEKSLYRTEKSTYGELQEGIFRIAMSLRAQGLKPGDRLILRGENSARWMMTFYACVLLQIVVVPIDASFSKEFVEKIRELTEAKWICSDHASDDWNELFKAKPISKESILRPQDRSALLEIIYTSGATGEPKGVMITHGNLLSNLTPIYDELQKYKKYAIPFNPIGFLHLIPMSHLFGQIMGLFIPQMIPGFVVFADPAPARVLRTVHQHKVSAVVCVPQELTLLRKYIEQRFGNTEVSFPGKKQENFVYRYFKYRKIHLEFGWKFFAFIVGGATLPVADEDFWNGRAFPIVQGYGLTETAPSVTISHPFKGLRRGFVGKTLPGVEAKISNEGEVLVRGPNVSPGYYHNDPATKEAFQDGWLKTGDLGQFDKDGHLQLLGRKKEVIVTPEGLNVYPQDVEQAVLKDDRIRDCAIVARQEENHPVVHAVLILAGQVSRDVAPQIIAEANLRMEPFQRIRSFSFWHDSELPRTSTGKLKRLFIATGIESEVIAEGHPLNLADRILGGSSSDAARLDEDLGLTSLDRVELMLELERKGAVVDDVSFAEVKTVGEVAKLIEHPIRSAGTTYPYWKWPQWWALRALRFVALYLLVLPMLRIRVKLKVSGAENLSLLKSPFLFVSNHQGYLDVPVILKALPVSLRRKIAPAMGTDRTKFEQYAAAIFFNTYPLPGDSIGLKQALERTGELVDQGYSPMVFPEGKMTLDGKLQPFRPGIGIIAKRMKLPVIPVLLRGVFEIWPVTARGPSKGTAEVIFGRPFQFSGEEPAEITATLESWYVKQIS